MKLLATKSQSLAMLPAMAKSKAIRDQFSP